jgi:hypothetical protein
LARRNQSHTLPDLSGLLGRNLINVALDTVLGGPAITTYPDVALWHGLVRLTDKSVNEYESARQAVAQWETGTAGDLAPLFLAIDNFENCITSTHRGVLYAKGLRALGRGSSALLPTAKQYDDLRLMRNRIEHCDERLITGKIRQGQSSILNPKAHRLELGERRITYRDLASVIAKLHRMVGRIRGVPGV